MTIIIERNMAYSKAIEILNNIDKHSEKDVVSAIYKIKGMATVNAVSKTALMNAVKWLFDEAFVEEGEL
jgi:ribosome-interacting GTPase 1